MKKDQRIAALRSQWETVLRDCEETLQQIPASIRAFGDAVAQMARELEDAYGEERLTVADRGAAFLEMRHRDLMEQMAASFALNDVFEDWKAAAAKTVCDLYEAEETSDGEAFSIIRDLEKRLRETETNFLARRTAWDAFCRETVPVFLTRLYRLTDGEHGGAAFRPSSTLALCGEMELEVERVLRPSCK